MFKKQLLILLCIFWAQHSSCLVDDVFTFVKLSLQLVNHINTADAGKTSVTNFVAWLKQTDNHQQIIDQLNVINQKLDDFRSYTRDRQNYIALLIEQLPAELAIQSKKDRLVSFILAVNRLWDEFTSYMKHVATSEMFDGLADNILASLKLQLEEFRNVLTPSSEAINLSQKGLFTLIVENADKKRDILCDQGETSHHRLLCLFHIAVVTEVKANTLLFIAHFLKYARGDAWMTPLITKFKKQFNSTVDMLSNSIKIAKLPYIRSCDPNVWQTDDNYYGLYGYHQQTIYYVPPFSSDECPFCKDLNEGKGWKLYWNGERNCSINPLNDHSTCEGSPFGCIDLSMYSGDLITCAWSSTPILPMILILLHIDIFKCDRSSNRVSYKLQQDKGPSKVRFVKYGSQIYGSDKESMELLAKNDEITCPSGNGYYRRWWQRMGDTEFACSCQCSKSTVKIALDVMTSNTVHNYVIVGVRIRQLKDYIYIQIAEGKLTSTGYIANSSWVKPDITFGWGNLQTESADNLHNSFFLGDTQLRPGFALTSIGFSKTGTGVIAGFTLDIRGMKFDYKTGKLHQKTNNYKMVDSEDNHELTFPLKTPINKVAHERSSPKSDGYTHVRLQRSDLSDDYGQTTLPLLDGVPLLTNPLSPIGGVGLFYKGYAESYAGFLSLRVYPLNFTYYMDIFKEMHDVNSLFD